MGLQGLNFDTERARSLQARLARQAAANARRVDCPHCGLRVAADGLTRHVLLCHEDER